MENTKKKGLPVFIGVASVWMGTHFGPGVASGTQLNQYYVNFGLPGIIMTVVAMGILAFALYCSMEFSRIYKAYDYESWVTKLFNNKYVVILFDVSFFVTIISAAGGSLNAIATLLQDFWGINYWLGVGIVIVVSMLLCAFGAELVRKSSAYMMFVVVGVLLLIMVLVVAAGDADLAGAVANQAQNLSRADWSAGNWLSALWQAIIYGSFQATIVANIASVADTLPDRRESKKAAVTGYLANTLLLIVLCVMLYSFTNVYAITEEDLPFYSMLARMDMSWLTVVYILVVFIAVISTVVGFAFAGVARFGKYYRPAGSKHLAHPLRDALFVLVLLAACAAISQVGIMNIVKYGYQLLGYINLFVIVLPALIIGGRKISKKYLKEHNIDAPGID